MTRLMHLADVHLGARLHGIERYDGAPPLDPVEAPYAAFEAIMDRALSERWDGVLIAGDLFDRAEHADRTVPTLQHALDALDEAGLPVAIIGGNHDAEVGLLSSLRLGRLATLFDDREPATTVWEALGIAIHGCSVASPDEERDLASRYPRPVPGLTNLGLLHTSLGGQWSRRPCAPTTPAVLDAAGYDYWALGHVHERMPVPGAPAWFAGSTHARRPDEHGPRGFLELTLDGGAVTATPVDTAPVQYRWLEASTPEEAEDAFAAVTGLPENGVVVWTARSLDLAVAREVAAGHDGFFVRGEAD